MDHACGICGRPFDESSVISINGSKDRVAELARRLTESKLALKTKRGKKRKLLQLRPDPDPGQSAVY